jgi:hypothetical protein
MKLVGYINNQKENAFQCPVYADRKGKMYTHTTDERYNIIAFEETQANQNFCTLYLSKKFSTNQKGALVFVGKDGYIHYNDAPSAIDEIIHYLNDHSALFNINGILDEAMLLKNRIFSDHFIVDEFVVKMQPKSEEIILSFDFPSPKKESFSTQEITAHEGQKRNSAVVEDENKSEFNEALRQLKSAEMNFELKLKLRSAERRSKLKMFNYQFKLNQNSRSKKAVDS